MDELLHEFHRGLDSSGISNIESAFVPKSIQDLGFMHADSSLNVIATYTDIGTKYKMVKRGGLAGLLGGKKVKEEKFELTREMDLSQFRCSLYSSRIWSTESRSYSRFCRCRNYYRCE